MLRPQFWNVALHCIALRSTLRSLNLKHVQVVLVFHHKSAFKKWQVQAALKTEEENEEVTQEATASWATAKVISIDSAVAAVSSELDGKEWFKRLSTAEKTHSLY